MEDKSRLVAVKTLCDIDENKAYSNIRLNHYFKKYNLEQIDRAFASEILYGTLRWKARIDYFIQRFSRVKIEKMSLWVLNCLRIAVYQIFFMDKVPDFAAVNQSVEIVKLKDKKSSSFVNGVLRNILRRRNEFDRIDIKDDIKRLSIEYSHPEWYVKKFSNELGRDFVVDLMKKNNLPPSLSIRVNTLKCTRDELKKVLNEKGIEVYDGKVEESLVLKGYGPIEKSEEFIKGLFTVQDESSMLVSRVLAPKPGERVMDLCSAPGGKTTHIAQLMKNNGEILAFDIHEHKLELVEQNASRLGIDIIRTYLKDSSIFMKEFENSSDRVLVDAPCSGLGLIRKKPEIRWNVTMKDIINLQKVQYEILKNASRYLKINGTLVYSTCTITHEENEEIIKKFLNEHDNFELVDICFLLPERFKVQTCKNGYIKLFPNMHDVDGFFISKLRRKW